MPRIQETHSWKQVSFPELFSAIGGATSFSVDRLISMLATAEKKKEDFKIVHQGAHFSVPLGLIQDYFKDHERPIARMSAKEELEYLRKRNAELETELRSAGVPATEMKPHPRFNRRLEGEGQDSSPIPPPRDEGIPVSEKLSPETLRNDLKKDLTGVSKLTRNSPTVRRSAAEAKL